ncbi:hypothetical protein [Gloeothece verrucosa]|uniref:Uncharacterized protein n=1 Tax=Gloeothece verrucosa (strain PCC 7822) TaxID=497965 RepID=E0UNG8_GLOV7|nr:hypothetical protein [Gloeothece verrucosa]ADN18498.1 hypothetical protein Cyan7822_6849 [Gloeothece verrucosa PCC 7822]
MVNFTPNTSTLNIGDNQTLTLINEQNERYIDLGETLSSYGKNLEWWQTLTPEKVKRLKSHGFSGKTQPISIILPNTKVETLPLITYSDWVAINSYFAYLRNVQALNSFSYITKDWMKLKLSKSS